MHRNVFSPVFFPNTIWFTNALLDKMPKVETFLEVGTGAGNVLVEVLLNGKCKRAVGLDISQQAIDNAKVNLAKYQINAELILSDVLENIEKNRKFDLIYWNYPYHYNFNKSYEEMSLIEHSLWDPEYHHLEKLLATAKEYLNPDGFIIFTFSPILGNNKLMKQLANKHGWIDSNLIQRPAN